LQLGELWRSVFFLHFNHLSNLDINFKGMSWERTNRDALSQACSRVNRFRGGKVIMTFLGDIAVEGVEAGAAEGGDVSWVGLDTAALSVGILGVFWKYG
jgi:hypothetical protein